MRQLKASFQLPLNRMYSPLFEKEEAKHQLVF